MLHSPHLHSMMLLLAKSLWTSFLSPSSSPTYTRLSHFLLILCDPSSFPWFQRLYCMLGCHFSLLPNACHLQRDSLIFLIKFQDRRCEGLNLWCPRIPHSKEEGKPIFTEFLLCARLYARFLINIIWLNSQSNSMSYALLTYSHR